MLVPWLVRNVNKPKMCGQATPVLHQGRGLVYRVPHRPHPEPNPPHHETKPVAPNRRPLPLEWDHRVQRSSAVNHSSCSCNSEQLRGAVRASECRQLAIRPRLPRPTASVAAFHVNAPRDRLARLWRKWVLCTAMLFDQSDAAYADLDLAYTREWLVGRDQRSARILPRSST